MSEAELEELGPIDYVVLEWAGQQPTADEVAPLLLDLVDRGIIRILDIAFVTKDPDGSVSGVQFGDLNETAAAFAEFEGAASGLLGFDDLEEAATAVSNRVSRRQAQRWQRQGTYPYGQPAPTYQEPQPQYAAPPEPQPQQDMIQQLKDLAELKDQGILTEEEFAAQKARILGS